MTQEEAKQLIRDAILQIIRPDSFGERVVQVGEEDLSLRVPSTDNDHIYQVFVGEKLYKVDIDIEEWP